MKLYHNAQHTLIAFLAAMIFALLPQDAAAQDGGMQKATVRVRIQAGMKSATYKYETVQYASLRSRRKAAELTEQLQKIIERGAKTGMAKEEIEEMSTRSGIQWSLSDPTGTIVLNAMAGQGIVVLGDYQTKVAMVEIRPGFNTYDVTLKSDSRVLDEVRVTGRRTQTGIAMSDEGGMDNGAEISFPVALSLPAGYTTNDSRLIIQPIIVDCQTEDTVAYMPPMVFEGTRYNRLQNRRMDFDYEKNDPLAHALVRNEPLRTGMPFSFKENIRFRKPDRHRSYRCNYVCSIEDYLHIIWDSWDKQTGSCRTFRPFKFVDFAVAAVDMPLTREFYEAAESNFDSYQQDIQLKFVQGKDQLANDSTNDATLGRLNRQLESYGDKLWNLSVEGSSSPEGSTERYTALAEQRAAKASQLLHGVPADVRRNVLPPRIYTWADVVDELRQQKDTAVTNVVAAIVAANPPRSVYALLKDMPFFDTKIEPILRRQRAIRVKYMVQRERVMTPDEAADYYYANKQGLISGSKRLSNGDFYNLFATVKDSAELDTITEIAYRQLKAVPAYERLRIAPYVANRMALLQIRRGQPDPGILRPFADLDIKTADHTKRIDEFSSTTVNRWQLMANLAVSYFQNDVLDTAQYIVNTYLQQGEATRKLRMFVEFKTGYINYLTGNITDPAQIDRIREAEQYVMNSSEENRAILWAEFNAKIGRTEDDIMPLLMRMDDGNPKKWYLIGMMWSKTADDDNLFDDGTQPDTDRLPAKPDDFLACMQHCFDMKPEYMRLFAGDGNIPDNVRRKHPYSEKNAEAYRQRFEEIRKVLLRKKNATENNEQQR